VSQAIGHFTQPRGEFTLVIEGAPGGERGELTAEVEAELRRLKRQGMAARDAIAQVARATGLPRRELYQAWLRLG